MTGISIQSVPSGVVVRDNVITHNRTGIDISSTNLKDFSGNRLGTTSPVFSSANSAEPGYSAQIPVEFGGTAVAPGGQPDVLGAASANVDLTPYLDSGTDTNVETAGGRGTTGFQGDQSSLGVTAASAQTGATGRIQEGINLVAGSSMTVNVVAGTYTGSPDLTGKSITLAPSGGPAQETMTGNFVLTAGTTLAMELNGTTPGSGHDQLVINGNGVVNPGGASLSLSLGFTPAAGSVFTIIVHDASGHTRKPHGDRWIFRKRKPPRPHLVRGFARREGDRRPRPGRRGARQPNRPRRRRRSALAGVASVRLTSRSGRDRTPFPQRK